MNLLKTIIERLNQRVEVANIFDKQFNLCELNANGNEKAWVHYIGNGQAEVVTNFDAKNGTLFWAKRGKVSVAKTDAYKMSGCKQLYVTSFPLTAYAIVRKSHLPCDAEDAQDWLASRVYKLTSGTDPLFKQSIGVINYEVVPSGYTNEIKTLTANYEWACVSVDMDVQVITTSEDGCYDTCATGDIPLPDLQPCVPCLTEVAVDGVTIIGNGTAADPLVAVGGGGGAIIVQDEGDEVTPIATTLNFTGAGVTASLTSPGVVEVNVPGGGSGGVGTLQEVTDLGNSTTNDIAFTASAGLSFDNGAFFRKGTTDAGNGGAKGTAQICSISYELKWEAGRLYYMEQDGFTIRDVTHNFAIVPQPTDDSTKGFVVGSRWSLDDGTVYECSDATIGTAVWSVVSTGGVTNVTATSPIFSSGGATPDISIQPASSVDDGYLTSADWNTFDGKFDVPTGTNADYLDGTGAPTLFPTLPTGTVTSVATSGLISGGTITTSGTISTSMATDKLVGRYSASTGVMEEITIGSGLTLTGAGTLNNTATPTPLGYYGAFSDITSQTAAAINTGYPMLLGITDLSNQVTVVSGSRVTIANTGIYNIQWSAQFTNPTAAEHDVTIWLRKNGVDVPGSAGVVLVPAKHGSFDGHTLPSWNFLLDVVAGDYYEFVWSTNNTSVYISFQAAGNPPPSTASVVLTVTQQSGIMAGTGITAINSLTGAAQTLVAGTTGTDFAVSSAGTTHTFNLPTASATNRGALSTADWTTFNGKVATTRSIGTTAPLTGGGNLSADRTIAIAKATASVDGYLAASDFTTFAAKQNAITPAALTKTDDTNVTLTLGGTPSTALLQATSLTLGWSGTLADGRIASAATWNAKQDALVSGTNIKTINSTSLLGSGNISIAAMGVYKILTDGAASSGTANTFSQSVLVPGNSVVLNNVVEFKMRARKTGAAGLYTIRLYANTTNNLSGSPILLATFTATSTNAIGMQMIRTAAIKNATTNTEMALSTATNAADYGNTSFASIAVDWTTDKYIIGAVQNVSAGDSSLISYISMTIV